MATICRGHETEKIGILCALQTFVGNDQQGSAVLCHFFTNLFTKRALWKKGISLMVELTTVNMKPKMRYPFQKKILTVAVNETRLLGNDPQVAIDLMVVPINRDLGSIRALRSQKRGF